MDRQFSFSNIIRCTDTQRHAYTRKQILTHTQSVLPCLVRLAADECDSCINVRFGNLLTMIVVSFSAEFGERCRKKSKKNVKTAFFMFFFHFCDWNFQSFSIWFCFCFFYLTFSLVMVNVRMASPVISTIDAALYSPYVKRTTYTHRLTLTQIIT